MLNDFIVDHNIVSILARPEGRALRKKDFPVGQTLSRFQSSPAPKGGRYQHSNKKIEYWNMFQSSPAPKGGRYLILHYYTY